MGKVVQFPDNYGNISIEVTTRNGEVDTVFLPDGMTQKELVTQISEVLWAAGGLEGSKDDLIATVQIYDTGRVVTQMLEDTRKTKKQRKWYKRRLQEVKRMLLSDA